MADATSTQVDKDLTPTLNLMPLTEQDSLHASTQVDKDLRRMLLKADAPPPKTIGVRVWPKAIPQFNVAHLDTVQARPLASRVRVRPLP